MTPAVAAVAVSALLDAAAGEPPAPVHPVVAMGRWLRAAERLTPARPPLPALLGGALACGLGAVAAAGGGLVVARSAGRLPRWQRALAEAVALWPLWSARLLLTEVRAVEAALHEDSAAGRAEPVAGRVAVARLVSRDTTGLDAAGVRAAALESLAENLSDSVVAPLFWYAVGGLPAAAGYRFVNTADACWGYRDPRWEYAGKVAARGDDLANLLPARLTAGLLLAGAPRSRWRALAGEARRTPSPNAGWPMAALALRLDRRLAKPATYTLNPRAAPPDREDADRALRLAGRVVTAAVVAAELGVLARGWPCLR